MTNVLRFPGQTKAPIIPERILDEAQIADLTEVVVLGYDASGEPYFSSSTSDLGELVLLLERAKVDLLTGVYGPIER